MPVKLLFARWTFNHD